MFSIQLFFSHASVKKKIKNNFLDIKFSSKPIQGTFCLEKRSQNESCSIYMSDQLNILNKLLSGFKILAGPAYTLTYTGWVDGNYDSDYGTDKGLDYQRDNPFSTADKDQSGNSCAEHYGGGWWFDYCDWLNLNNAEALSPTFSHLYMSYNIHLNGSWKSFGVRSSEMRMLKID